MIIDALGFLGETAERRNTAAWLGPYLDACGVQRLLVGHLDAAATGVDRDEVEGNLACLAACRDEPRLAPLYTIRPGRPDSHPHVLRGALLSEPLAGVLLAPALMGVGIDDRLLDPWLAAAAEQRAAAVVLVGRDAATRAMRAHALARRHPTLALVICQAARERDWPESLAAVSRSIEREDSRVFLGTAHASAAEVLEAVRTVGADRLVLASDAACHGAQHAARVSGLLGELRDALPEDALAKIVASNARRLFRLEAPRAVAAPRSEREAQASA